MDISRKINRLRIVPLDAEHTGEINSTDGTFAVSSHLVLKTENNSISYEVEQVTEAYTKSYLDYDIDYTPYIEGKDHAAYLAYFGQDLAGHIVIRKNWNRFCYIEDIRVEAKYRGMGVGKKLMDTAIAWAKQGDMPGMMVETQDNNIPAVRFYERCGFQLGGFDRNLYKGVNPKSIEVALFWYLLF